MIHPLKRVKETVWRAVKSAIAAYGKARKYEQVATEKGRLAQHKFDKISQKGGNAREDFLPKSLQNTKAIKIKKDEMN